MKENPSLVGQVISGCEILEKTAEGGMGAVYRARHKALDRTVCVKILSPSLSEDKKAVELFLTEARAIAQIDHPNIVNVYNVGKESGYYFIVMSFVEGQTLSAKLKKEKLIPIDTVLDIFDGVLQGLTAAHEKGIIHRDIKPSNILITPQGQAKLVDFGIAKKVNKTGSTKTTELAGTAYFIAPEQALGSSLDTRADLYSVGASMYYVLTGHFPYNGKNTIDIIQKHINDPIPDPSNLRRELPGWLVQIIQKLMAKNPDDRFQSAKEVSDFIRKMRAEDQLRIKTNPNKHAIDLTQAGPQLVIQQDRTITQTTRDKKLRKEKQEKESVAAPAPNVLMPDVDASPTEPDPSRSFSRKRKSQSEEGLMMPSAVDVKPMAVYTPTAQKSIVNKGKFTAFVGMNLKKILSLLLFLPLFTAIASLVVGTFYALGSTSSVHISETADFVQNFMAPFTATPFAPNQLMLFGVCAVVLLLIFAVSIIKAFSHTTATLLFLALTSFLAGLFTPSVPFMEIGKAFGNLFSPEYALCYLVLALVGTLSICFTINRSASQGLLGAALALLAIETAYLAAHLSIPPNQQDMFFPTIFYVSLFCGLCTVFYLTSRANKDSVVLPVFLFLVAVSGMWVYTVSGLVSSMQDTSNVLIARVPVKAYAKANKNTPSGEVEKEYFANREKFQVFDRTNELTGLSREETIALLGPRIEKVVPGVFDEDLKPFFIDLLARYHKGGRERVKSRIWLYALTFPVHNFNKDARENDAYFFLISLLYLFGLLSCAGTILFQEDL